MSRARLTLLVEDLAALAAAADGVQCPALERCLARGRRLPVKGDGNVDSLRLELFGAAHDGPVPVAALTAVADNLAEVGDNRFWLRIDPVTLTADLTRVFVTAHGLADIGEADRAALRECVRATLAETGHALENGHPDRWLIASPESPGCRFMRLDDALGLDLAEALPKVAEGREWRRLLTELQVALHNADFNARRRAAGQREINGAWIWGEGRLPERIPAGGFDRVLSDHPVSRGLASLAGIAIEAADDAEEIARMEPGSRVLLDWPTGRSGASRELARVERMVGTLLTDVRRGRLELTLLDGSGAGWRLESAELRRVWRRRRPLRVQLGGGNGAAQ